MFLVCIWTYLVCINILTIYSVVVVLTHHNFEGLNFKYGQVAFVITCILILVFGFLFIAPVTQLLVSHILNFYHA